MANVSFYLITDSHYLSKNNWVKGKEINDRVRNDQIALIYTPDILDTFIDKIIADGETDTVLFLGDNVDNGDLTSHNEFRQRLEKLVNAGKKVYVIYATHDYCGIGDDNNIFVSKIFHKYVITLNKPMRRVGLFDFYCDYGPKQALSLHRDSGSYTVKLGDGVRLICINDNGNGGGYCGLDEDGLLWLKNELKTANTQGDYVLVAVHHPVIPPWDVYGNVAEHELYGGYRYLRELLCDNNVRVIFTGHTHVQNIRKYTNENGRYFYDVSTIALANAACKMRRVTVDTEKGICDVKSIGVDRINGLETDGESHYEHMYQLNFPGILEKLIPLAQSDYDAFLDLANGYIPLGILKKYKRLVRFAIRRLSKLRLSAIAKLGGVWRKLTEPQKAEAKSKKALDGLLVILSHIFTGNAPFTPETLEYKVYDGFTARVDSVINFFNIRSVKAVFPEGSSFRDVSKDFIYNNRTGNDDEITIDLKYSGEGEKAE